MYCPNCGKEIPEVSKFCPYCGKKLEGEIGLSNKTGNIVESKYESKGLISKILALIALISFLFFPQVSCSNYSSFNGIRLVQESFKDPSNSYSVGFIIIFIVIISSCLIVFISGKSIYTRVIFGIVGLISEIIFLILINSGEAKDFLKTEWGYFLTLISFVFVIIGDSIEKAFKK